MTRRIITYLMGAMVVFSLVACTPTSEKKETSGETVVAATTGGASDKVPDPNVEPVDIVSVYALNEAKTGLSKSMDDVEKLTAQALVDKLIEYKQLPEGTKATSFESKDGAAVLDLSELPKLSDKEMTLTVTVIGNTFIENFELDKLKLKVAGKDYKDLTYKSDYKEMK